MKIIDSTPKVKLGRVNDFEKGTVIKSHATKNIFIVTLEGTGKKVLVNLKTGNRDTSNHNGFHEVEAELHIL